jgi:enoyl-CoA hydratase/carnithine racemase
MAAPGQEEEMAGECVLVEKSDGVAILTMNRPEQLNAMSHRLSSELHDAVTRMSADDEVGCIVITGAGNRAFSAGGDIHEQREDDRRYTQAELDDRNAVRARGSYEISACPKPTIGMINGLAYGGAGVLASSLDMRVGCEHASFRFLAAAYGRINSTWTLPNQVGWPVAKELLFSGRVVGDDDCQEPPRGGDGREGPAPQGHGMHAGSAVGERAGLHDERDEGRQGRAGLPGVHRPQRATPIVLSRMVTSLV